MSRRPPRTTRTYTPFPYTTRIRSFLFENEAQAQRVLDGPVGQKLAAKLETKGIKLLGWMEGGFRNMINNVRPVEKPEDVKGVKRSEEHTSELQSLMRISYAVFCLKKKKNKQSEDRMKS